MSDVNNFHLCFANMSMAMITASGEICSAKSSCIPILTFPHRPFPNSWEKSGQAYYSIFGTYLFHNTSTVYREYLKIKKIPLYIRNRRSIKVFVARLERPKTNLKIKSICLESTSEAVQNS